MALPIKTFFVSMVLLASGCAYHSKFSDRRLEERFRSHESDFKQLVQMLSEDSEFARVTRDAAYTVYDRKMITDSPRLGDYRKLLSKLELDSVSKVVGAGNVRIYFAAWNRNDFPYGGTNEYFVYAVTPPAEARYLVESLDKLRTQTDAYAFKKIADRWYLHVDNW